MYKLPGTAIQYIRNFNLKILFDFNFKILFDSIIKSQINNVLFRIDHNE